MFKFNSVKEMNDAFSKFEEMINLIASNDLKITTVKGNDISDGSEVKRLEVHTDGCVVSFGFKVDTSDNVQITHTKTGEGYTKDDSTLEQVVYIFKSLNDRIAKIECRLNKSKATRERIKQENKKELEDLGDYLTSLDERLHTIETNLGIRSIW